MCLIGALSNRPRNAADTPTYNRIHDRANEQRSTHCGWNTILMVEVMPGDILRELHEHDPKDGPKDDTVPEDEVAFSLDAQLLPLTKVFGCPGYTKHAVEH